MPDNLNNLKRASVFVDTTERFQSLATSTLVEEGSVPGKPSDRPGVIEIHNEDSLHAVARCTKPGMRVCIVNNANARKAGGDTVVGDLAQEEELMRRSNYFKGLEVFVTPDWKDKENCYNLPWYCPGVSEILLNKGCILTKDIELLKANEKQGYADLKEKHVFDAIATAACNISSKEQADSEGLLLSNGSVDYEEYKSRMEAKIRTEIYVAISHGYRVFIPSALGCGAFRSFEEKASKKPPGFTARMVAEIYHKILIVEKNRDHFDLVSFAVYDGIYADPQRSNCAIFQKTFGLKVNVVCRDVMQRVVQPKSITQRFSAKRDASSIESPSFNSPDKKRTNINRAPPRGPMPLKNR